MRAVYQRLIGNGFFEVIAQYETEGDYLISGSG